MHHTLNENSFTPKRRRQAEKAVRKLLAKAKSAHLAGERKRVSFAVTRYFQSWDSRVVATWTAYRSLKPYSRPDRKLLPAVAASLCPFATNDETVIVILKKKANGDHRTLMEFGIRNRAKQYQLMLFLNEVADTHPTQFMLRGGLPAAINRVVALLKEGFTYVVETDISDCFPSFDGQDLDKFLPLPKKVIDQSILAKHLNLSPSDSMLHIVGPADSEDEAPLLSDCLASARRGIPHGSAASSIVAEILLAPILAALPPTGRYVNYGDNILSMAKSHEEAVTISKAVRSAIKAHPVGHLQPTQDRIFEPREHFEFLGHRIRKEGDSVSIAPSCENSNGFRKKLKHELKILRKIGLSGQSRKMRARRLRGFIKSWAGAFALCNGMPAYCELCLGYVEQALKNGPDKVSDKLKVAA